MFVLRVLIVDDEPLGRERIRTLLGSRNDVVVAGEAEDGIEAVGLLESETFDLVFLDIQMPPVVFVTAHDEFALKAFEVHALDYLLKPFEPDRFYEALDRVIGLIGSEGLGEIDMRVKKLIADLDPKERPLDRLMVRSHGSIRFVKVEDIDYIEAAGKSATTTPIRTTIRPASTSLISVNFDPRKAQAREHQCEDQGPVFRSPTASFRKEHGLSFYETFRFKPVEIDAAAVVLSVPNNKVPAGRLLSCDEFCYRPSKHVKDLDPGVRRFRKIILDGRRGIKGVRVVLTEGKYFGRFDVAIDGGRDAGVIRKDV